MPTMQSRRQYRSAKRSRWAWNNSPAGLRNRRAKADARRETLAATLPPVPTGPEPLTLWQTITVQIYVPTSGRCDQHAVVIDGEEVGLLSATEIGVKVRGLVLKRPSFDVLAEARRDCVLQRG